MDLTRRDFLKAGLVAAGTPLLLSPPCTGICEASSQDGEGSCTTNLVYFKARQWVTGLVFTFTVGASGLSSGGAVRWYFPKKSRHDPIDLLWKNPWLESPANCCLLVPGYTEGIDYAVRKGLNYIQVKAKPGRTLAPGTQIELTYGLPSRPGKCQKIATTNRWLGRSLWHIESRATRTGHFRRIANPPYFIVAPRATIAKLLVVIPLTLHWDGSRSEPFRLAVVALDKFGNRVTSSAATVNLFAEDTQGSPVAISGLGSSVELVAGAVEVDNIWFARRPGNGFARIRASCSTATSIANFAYLDPAPPAYAWLAGDSHFHAGRIMTGDRSFIWAGGDHRGEYVEAGENLAYARDVARLDWAATAEHDTEFPGPVKAERSWAQLKATNASFEGERFHVLLGYEWTSPGSYTKGVNHRNIWQAAEEAAPFLRWTDPSSDTAEEVRDAVEAAGPAVMCAHIHNAKYHGFDPESADYFRDNNFMRLCEIFSHHNFGRKSWPLTSLPGLSDTEFGCRRYELESPSRPSSKHSIRQALRGGFVFGFTGASDGHVGQPGLPFWNGLWNHHFSGLTVVLAEANTKDALWNALTERRTYATTGVRIYAHLAVGVDGGAANQMGVEDTVVGGTHTFNVALRFCGTRRLSWVKLFRSVNGAEFVRVHSAKPAAKAYKAMVNDTLSVAAGDQIVYYAACRQVKEGHMAWCSPVFFRGV